MFTRPGIGKKKHVPNHQPDHRRSLGPLGRRARESTWARAVGDRHRGVFRFKEIEVLDAAEAQGGAPVRWQGKNTKNYRVYDGYIYIVNGDYDNL